ncbi:MAG TPA: hydantoinase/oxoprolinase family protein [Gemmatimonadales bacterium]|nr:hydantoinase/oxoprolinase family protein [Gemmatimonadales bacterium]
MPTEAVIGWDLGGAHLKAARLGSGGRVERVTQLPCALWRGLAELHAALDAAVAQVGTAELHAVTMTGEMVDLFPSRAQGVRTLVELMGDRFGADRLRIFDSDGGFGSPAEALAAPLRVASVNWLAAAAVVAALEPDALVIDVGSTTTDLITVRGGRIRARGRDDAARLASGELVYAGVVRTPVMAMAEAVPFGGTKVPLIAEWFAAAGDVYRLTGQLPEGADQHPTADGGDKSVAASARRLARMIGRDAESVVPERWRELAEWLAHAQARRLHAAAERLLADEPLPPDAPVVAAGVGRFMVVELARDLGRRVIEFGVLLPVAPDQRNRVTDCAPAAAVAWLAAREFEPVSPPVAAGQPRGR